MKRIICLVMVLAMLCTAAMAETFEGVGKGFGGEIKVAATVEGGKLTAVEVLSHGETAGISDPAFAKIPAAIIENQTVAVDTVAGCTFSSNGLIEAITAAWVASGANLEDISKEIVMDNTAKELETKTADVVIIGAGGAGSDFVLPQYEFVKANGGEVIRLHKVEELIMENGRVVGAKGTANDGTPFEYRANKSVILATGGFGANVEMRQRFNKFWANLDETVGTTNQPCATGDGIALAEGVGANLIGMEWIQLVTGGVGSFTASIANNIYVNADGERFVAEDSRRDVLSGAVLAQEGSFFWLLSDAKTVWDLMGGKDYTGRTLEQMKERGVVEAETIEELAVLMGCDPVKLQASIDQHNKAVTGEEADPFGRQLYEFTFDKGPYYAGKGQAKVHHTMGGVEINTNAEVLDVNGNVIPGFYAASEVTGGIHGANRLGGNAIADIIVFGQIAGQNAMK